MREKGEVSERDVTLPHRVCTPARVLRAIRVATAGLVGEGTEPSPALDDVGPITAEPVDGGLHECFDLVRVADDSRAVIRTRPLGEPERLAESGVEILTGCQEICIYHKMPPYLSIGDEVGRVGAVEMKGDEGVLASAVARCNPVLSGMVRLGIHSHVDDFTCSQALPPRATAGAPIEYDPPRLFTHC